MQLTILGSNGTYPTAGRPAAGYLVSHLGTRLWLDAGPGTYQALASEMDPRDVSGVLLSHRHPDHCSDVFALYHALAYAERPFPQVPVFVPEGLEQRLCDFVESSADAMRRVFGFRTVGEGARIELGDLDITIAMAAHPPPTISPRITAGGKTLTYTADSGPSERLEEHAAGSDLLLAEATLDSTEDGRAVHMTGAEAGSMARRAGARRLMLTHIAPYVDPEKSVADAESEFDGEVTIAVPGTRVAV